MRFQPSSDHPSHCVYQSPVLVGYNPSGPSSYMVYGTLDGAPRGRLGINPNASSFGLIRAGR